MRLTDQLYLIGSGALGSSLTDIYDCNVYLIDTGGSVLLIDSGAGIRPELITAEMKKDGFEPERISHLIVTHAHADHSGGAAALQRMTGARIICSTATAYIMQSGDEAAVSLPQARRVGMYPPDYKLNAFHPSIEVHHGNKLQVGNLTFEIIETPGHSADMISCYIPELKVMFCSDVLFEGGKIAMQVAPDFSMFELANSVRVLSGYEVEQLLPGHLSPVMSNGSLLIEQVKHTFDALKIPPNIV
ncbi:MBL fold metallo-hydrolase [Paenibacillus agricola]|uniref:beta-lactamase n=1 Tax=Paenibacillus agricola TaxID=2716264 RepID=A0ABX0JFZ3_9BACL|nr:MBL fold metallo-hydrolase [Paenibacillus agricola]NHN32756.1 MBL fold metallo-hydrolase [Paenibacillus agricola]